MDLSVVIPAYDAEEFVAARLRILDAYLAGCGLDYEIIPVDDGSRDGTARALESAAGPRIRPLLGGPHRGKFGAIRRGFEAARGDVVAFTDADVPYDLAAIRYMAGLVRSGAYHVVVGDRTLPGSIYTERLGRLRGLATRVYSWLIRVLVTGGLHDTQCGLKALRADVAKALVAVLREDGFPGDVELLYVALKHNLSIRRVPVRLQFQSRSTVRPLRHGLTMTTSLLRIRRRFRRGAYASPALEALGRQDYWSDG
jgi:dolichyl-phosphate beta-glucosyltransferase